jgi:hypothetical protein
MSDEKGEPTPTNEGPDSRLTERLLSRGTDSLGLIDVRGAERHYARIMDWLAARAPLLERLRTRYGLTEWQGLTGLAFAEPAGREGSRAVDAAVNLSAAPVGFVAPAAEQQFTAPLSEQIFTHVAHVPDEPAAAQTEAKRIARRGVPTFSNAGMSQGSVEAPRQEREASGERREAFKPALELAAPHQEQAQPNQEQARPSPRQVSGLQSTLPAEETPAATAKSPADESTTLHARRTLPSVEEQAAPATAKHDKPLARGSTKTNEDDAVNNTTAASEPRGAARSGAPRVTESPAPDAITSTPPRYVQAVARERVSVTAAPKVEAPTGEKLSVAGEARAASASADAPRTLAHAREIREGDNGRASVGLHAQTPLPLAPGTAAAERAEPTRHQSAPAHAVASAQSASGVTENFMPGDTRAQARAEEVNVERLTEQVSRHLARRLLIERERRGLGRK